MKKLYSLKYYVARLEKTFLSGYYFSKASDVENAKNIIEKEFPTFKVEAFELRGDQVEELIPFQMCKYASPKLFNNIEEFKKFMQENLDINTNEQSK